MFFVKCSKQSFRIFISVLFLCLGLVISGCQGKKVEETTTPSESTVVTTESSQETTVLASESKVEVEEDVNPLTGKSIDPELVGFRSAAIVINNHPKALPARGVSLADVYYEYETEGGQTRLLTLFSDIEKIPEIGSLRSARIVAADLAAGTNSIFIHYGKNARVPAFIQENNISHIDGNDVSANSGLSADGKIDLPDRIFFWRDNLWKAKRALEHTAVSNGFHILRAIEFYNIEREGETPPLFSFSKQPLEWSKEAAICKKLIVYFSGNNSDSTFTYDPETKLYLKSEYKNQPQIDETTGEQISVENVFVFFANIKSRGDTTVDVYLTEGGTGYYASEGKIIPIVWSKQNPNSPIVVKDSEGKTVEVNPGKSYINIVRNSFEDRLQILSD